MQLNIKKKGIKMIRTLIGSSNVYRHYKPDEFKEYNDYKMVKCTKKETFVAVLDDIEKGKGEVVISVVENLLCDAIGGNTDPEAMNQILEEEIKTFLSIIKDVATKRQDLKIAVAQPTLRPLHQWFTDSHEAFCKKIAEGIRQMDLRNVGKIDGPIKMSQVFEEDGVHLTPCSGKVFVNTILYNADAFFTAELIDLEEEMEIDRMDGGEKEKVDEKKEQLAKKILTVEKEFDCLNGISKP